MRSSHIPRLATTFTSLAGLALMLAACSESATAPKSVLAPAGPEFTVGPLQSPPAGATTIAIASSGSTQYCGHSDANFAPTFATVFTGSCVAANDLTSALVTYNPGWDAPFATSSWIGSNALANQYTVVPGTYDFRTTFTLPVGATSPLLNLSTMADNVAIVYLNGHEVGRNTPTQDCPIGGPCNWQQIGKVTMYDNTASDFVIGGTNTIDVFLIDMRIGVGPAGSPAPPAFNGHSCELGPQPLGVGGVPTPQYAQFLAGTWLPSDCLNPAGLDFVGAAYYVPPAVNHGCTLGFWKTHTPWTGTGYTTDETLTAAGFTSTGTSGSVSMLDALSFSGGNTVQDAKNLLLKQAVAALLNAATPGMNYPLTTTEILNQVNAALATGNRGTILALAATLETDNSLEGPLC